MNLKRSLFARLSAFLFIVSSLSACSSAGLTLLNAQAKLFSNHTLIADIQYGENVWQQLDLYIPNNHQKARDTKANLVFFYGGSWDTGRKEQYYFVASKFANLGYWVIVPDYVKYPQGKFPTFIEDGAQAIAWLKENIDQYGGDPQNIFVAGHSAGAHLGALLLSDQTYLYNVGLEPSDIRAFAGLAGPYNFTPTEPEFVRIFEPPSNFPKLKVANFIDGDEPPMLLLQGDSDTSISLENLESTLSAIDAVDGIGQDIIYPGVSHVRILLGIASPSLGNSDPSTDIDHFFRKQMRVE